MATEVDTRPADPPAEMVRGTCPKCGLIVIADARYVEGYGYKIEYRCIGTSTGECDYRRTL